MAFLHALTLRRKASRCRSCPDKRGLAVLIRNQNIDARLPERDHVGIGVVRAAQVHCQDQLMLGGAALSFVARAERPECTLARPPRLAEGERLNSFEDITNYNNFYEFSTDKKAVAQLAAEAPTRPWKSPWEGEVQNPLTLDMEGLLGGMREDRVIGCAASKAGRCHPRNGIPAVQFDRTRAADFACKYVRFVGAYDPHATSDSAAKRCSGLTRKRDHNSEACIP